MNAVFEGLLCGFLLSFLLGPVFIGLINTSLTKGFKQGVFYALGVAISDVFYILLCYWGIMRLISNPAIEKMFYIVGGLLLIIFGLFYLFQKAKVAGADILNTESIVTSKKRNALFKGFLMNAINPSVLFFWIGIVGVVNATAGNDSYYVFLFFASAIGVVFSLDVLKAFLAHKISIWVKDYWLTYLNKFLGALLIIVGSMFIWDILKSF